MSKPYKFAPSLATVRNIPPEYQWVVQLRYGGSFSPVNTIPLIYCTDYTTAFECLEAWLPNSKKRLAYVKQRGIKHMHTKYDPMFAEALKMRDLDGSEYYEDPTADDQRFVQLHQKRGITRAIWRGAVVRDDGKQPSADSVIDIEGGLG